MREGVNTTREESKEEETSLREDKMQAREGTKCREERIESSQPSAKDITREQETCTRRPNSNEDVAEFGGGGCHGPL